MTTRHASRIWLVMAMLAGVAGFSFGVAQAKGKKEAASADAPKHEVNACGCYKDTAGACFCGKGKAGKCICPGDCEPKGCEQKRQKEFDKEVAAEKKKAHDADQKQRAKSHDASGAGKAKPSGVGQ